MSFSRYSKRIGNLSGDLKGYHEQSFSPGVGGFSAAMINSYGKNLYIPNSGSLRGAWLINEATGLVLHDYSPYGNHGLINANIDWKADGLYSSGDTSGQQVEIPDDLSLRFAGDMTVIMWARPEDPPSSYGAVKLAKWNGGGGTPGENEWIIGPQSGGTGIDAGNFSIEVGTTIYSASASSAPTMGQMYMITGVRRGEWLEYWRDGVLHNRTYVGSSPTNTLSTNPVRMFDQGDEAGPNGNRGKGTFILAALYGEAIHRSIIPQIYSAGLYHGIEDLEYAI